MSTHFALDQHQHQHQHQRQQEQHMEIHRSRRCDNYNYRTAINVYGKPTSTNASAQSVQAVVPSFSRRIPNIPNNETYIENDHDDDDDECCGGNVSEGEGESRSESESSSVGSSSLEIRQLLRDGGFMDNVGDEDEAVAVAAAAKSATAKSATATPNEEAGVQWEIDFSGWSFDTEKDDQDSNENNDADENNGNGYSSSYSSGNSLLGSSASGGGSGTFPSSLQRYGDDDDDNNNHNHNDGENDQDEKVVTAAQAPPPPPSPLEGLSTLQRSAMSAFLQSPTVDRWSDLVKTMKVERLIESWGFIPLGDERGRSWEDGIHVNNEDESFEFGCAHQQQEQRWAKEEEEEEDPLPESNDDKRDTWCDDSFPRTDLQAVKSTSTSDSDDDDGEDGRGLVVLTAPRATKLSNFNSNGGGGGGYFTTPGVDDVPKLEVFIPLEHNTTTPTAESASISSTRRTAMIDREDGRLYSDSDRSIYLQAPSDDSLQGHDLSVQSTTLAFMDSPNSKRWKELVQSLRKEEVGKQHEAAKRVCSASGLDPLNPTVPRSRTPVPIVRTSLPSPSLLQRTPHSPSLALTPLSTLTLASTPTSLLSSAAASESESLYSFDDYGHEEFSDDVDDDNSLLLFDSCSPLTTTPYAVTPSEKSSAVASAAAAMAALSTAEDNSNRQVLRHRYLSHTPYCYSKDDNYDHDEDNGDHHDSNCDYKNCHARFSRQGSDSSSSKDRFTAATSPCSSFSSNYGDDQDQPSGLGSTLTSDSPATDTADLSRSKQKLTEEAQSEPLSPSTLSASSSLPPAQQSAMDAFLATPTEERWGDLVETLREDKRRQRREERASRRSSSRNRSPSLLDRRRRKRQDRQCAAPSSSEEGSSLASSSRLELPILEVKGRRYSRSRKDSSDTTNENIGVLQSETPILPVIPMHDVIGDDSVSGFHDENGADIARMMENASSSLLLPGNHGNGSIMDTSLALPPSPSTRVLRDKSSNSSRCMSILPTLPTKWK